MQDTTPTEISMQPSWCIKFLKASPSQNELDSMHWAARGRLKDEWMWMAKANKVARSIPKATGKRRLTIERHGLGTLDMANLIGGAKQIIDALVDMGIFIDDRPSCLDLEKPVQIKLKRGQKPFTYFIIEEVA